MLFQMTEIPPHTHTILIPLVLKPNKQNDVPLKPTLTTLTPSPHPPSSQRQAQKVYEILRLKATDRSNGAQYKHYRLVVKKRLNAPYKRETESLKRLQPFLDPAEVAVMQPPESHDDHMTKLQDLYLEVESGYLKYIEKLATIV